MIYSKFYSKEMKLMMAIEDKDPNTITDIEFDNPITFLGAINPKKTWENTIFSLLPLLSSPSTLDIPEGNKKM
jgi:hypothetical protein